MAVSIAYIKNDKSYLNRIDCDAPQKNNPQLTLF